MKKICGIALLFCCTHVLFPCQENKRALLEEVSTRVPDLKKHTPAELLLLDVCKKQKVLHKTDFPPRSVYVQLGDKKISTTKNFLNKCEAYKAQQEFEKHQTKQKNQHVQKIPYMKMKRAYDDTDRDRFTQETVWDITELGQSCCGSLQEAWAAIASLVAYAAGSNNLRTETKQRLFSCIKLSDTLLMHNDVMHRYTGALLENLMGPMPVKMSKMTHDVSEMIPVHDGKHVLVSEEFSNEVTCFDLTGKKEPLTFKHREVVDDVVVVPDTNKFLVSGTRSIVCFDCTKDYSDGKEKPLEFEYQYLHPKIVVMPGTTKFFVYTPFSKDVMCFDCTKNYSKDKEKPLTVEHKEVVDHVVGVPGTDKFFVSGERSLMSYDINGKKESLEFEHQFRHPKIVGLPGTNKFFVSGDKSLICYGINGTKKLLTVEHGLDASTIVPMSDKSKFFVSGILDNKVLCFDCKKDYSEGKEKPSESVLKNRVEEVVVMPDGKHILVRCGSEVIRVDITDKKEPLTFDYGDSLGRMLVTPDGKHVFLRGFSKNVKCFDCAKDYSEGKEKPLTFEHGQIIRKMVVMPDTSKFLVGAGNDIVQWDLEPSLDLTLEQAEFCYNLFTHDKSVELLSGSQDYETFTNLPQELQDSMVKKGKVILSKPGVVGI